MIEPLDDLGLDVLRTLLHHDQPHVGRDAAEGGNDVGDAVGRVAGDGIKDREPQFAPEFPLEGGDVGGEIAEGLAKPTRGLEDRLASLCQAEAATPALAEREADALFQGGHVVADRRLPDVEFGLGASISAAADHCVEDLEKAQITSRDAHRSRFSMDERQGEP